jgi:outer membrane receptor protein involved in Fe transport
VSPSSVPRIPGTSGFLGSYAQVTDQARFPTAVAPRAVERADVSSRDFQVRGTAEKLAGDAKIEIGVDVNGRSGLHALDIKLAYDMQGEQTSETVNVSIDTAHRTDAGAYLTAEPGLGGRLTLAGGGRVDRVVMENRGGYFGDRSHDSTALSGFASVTAGSFRGFSLTGQVSSGFRDPTLSDRYYRGPTGRGYITGNPDLEPETSLQFDAALRYAGSRFRWAFYAFHYRITDLVERYETTKDNFFYRNRGQARIRGIALEGQADLGAGYTLELAGQITRGVAWDDDVAGSPEASTDDIPAENVSLQLRKQFTPKLFVQGRVGAYAVDDRPGPSEVRMPGYTVVDVSAGFRFNKNLDLRLVGRNLLDQSYYASPNPRWVWAPGASVLVTASVTY